MGMQMRGRGGNVSYAQTNMSYPAATRGGYRNNSREYMNP